MTVGEQDGARTGELPTRADDLSPPWLTRALRESGALSGGEVTDVVVEPCGTGQLGDCYRLTLTYAPSDGGPDHLVAKLAAQDPVSRQFGHLAGLYGNEVAFYRDLAHHLDVRCPEPYVADIDESTGTFVLLLEDLTPADECDQLTGCSLEAAAQAIDQAAALHGSSWDHPEVLDRAGSAEAYGLVAEMMGDLVTAFGDRYESALTERELGVLTGIVGHLGPWAEAMQAEARCLSHNDFRLDNMLFDGRAGEVPLTVVDWQSYCRAPGINDVAYFIGAGLPTATRRAHEQGLVRRYARAMAAYGVERPFEQWWADYRLHAVHGLVTAVHASVSVERTPRGDEMFLAMTRRHVEQMLDHDTLALLGAGG